MRFDCMGWEYLLAGSEVSIEKGKQVLMSMGIEPDTATDNLLYQVGSNPEDPELLAHVRELATEAKII